MGIKTLLYIIEGRDNLTPVMEKASVKMGALGEAAGKSFGMKMKTALNVAGPMALAAISAGFAFAIKAGMDVPLAQLKVTLKNAGTSFDAMKGSINATQDRMAKLGFTGAQVDQSIINLTRSTGSATLAIKMQGTVADLARAKHISLADAATLVSKAAEGQTRGLRGLGLELATGTTKTQALSLAEKMVAAQFSSTAQQADFASKHHMSLAHVHDLVTQAAKGNIGALNTLGVVVLPKTASAADRMSQIQKVLNERLGGTAAKQAKTFGGQLEVLKATFTNLAEKIGLAILPYLASFIGLLNKLASCKPLIIGIAIVIGALAVGFIAVHVAAMGAYVAENLALFGIPALCALAVVGIAWIVTHWNMVRNGFVEVWQWLGAHPWVAMFIPIIGVIILIQQNWQAFLNFFVLVWHAMNAAWQAVCNFIVGAWNSVCGALRVAWNAVGGWFLVVWNIFLNFWRGIGGGIAQAWDTVMQSLRNAWNAIGAWFIGVWGIFVKIWQGVGGSISVAWDATMGALRTAWNAIGGWFANVWGIFVKMWQGVGGTITDAWNTVMGSLHDAWNTFVDWIGNSWRDLSNFAGRIWDDIKNAIANPVKWVADHVWNFLADAIDAATSFLGMGRPVPHLNLAAGGRLPGFGGGDILPAMLEPGETVVDKHRSRLLAPVFAAAGVPGYAAGGMVGNRGVNGSQGLFDIPILGSLLHGIAGIAKSIGGWAKNMVQGGMADAATPIVHAITGIVDNLPGGDKGMGKVVTSTVHKLADGFLAWLRQQDSSFGGGGEAMLSFMMSQIGKPYSQAPGRFGPSYYDCSGLVYTAAHKAGIPITATLANTEIDWFASHGGKKVGTPARGDVLGIHGSEPGPSSFGPIGHIGVATSATQYVSALGHAYGVCVSTINGLVAAIRLPGGGGLSPAMGNIPANAAAIYSFLRGHGYSHFAAAGIIGNIQRESGGNPESVGSGGGGLIGFTPLPRGYVTGNAGKDLQTQLNALLAYNNIWHQYIPELNAAQNAASAASIYCSQFERPGIPAISQRIASANATAAKFTYDNGGILRPGYTLAYNGTGRDEYVTKGGGGPTVVVNGQAFLGSKREVARWVTEALTEYENKGGRVPWSK